MVVTAAAGGVGGLLVQLAAAAGAKVLALAGDEKKLALAAKLGAAHQLHYRQDDWAELLHQLAPTGVDVVFDGVGALTTDDLFPLVRNRGRYVQHGAASGSWGVIDDQAAASRDISVISLGAIGDTPAALFDLVERALTLTANRVIRPTIGQTFPLEQAALAHAAIEARRTLGKTLLTL